MNEFINGVYPRKLWIYNTKDLVKVKDNFTISETGEDINPSSDVIDYDCIVYNVHHCSLGYGILVCVENKLAPKQIAHESAHIALEIFKDCDCRIDYSNQEPFAYLLGWAYECVERFNQSMNEKKND